MTAAYPRSITFTIPGELGLKVTVVENAGNLDFTVEGSPQLTADFKGLLFELADESGAWQAENTGRRWSNYNTD